MWLAEKGKGKEERRRSFQINFKIIMSRKPNKEAGQRVLLRHRKEKGRERKGKKEIEI